MSDLTKIQTIIALQVGFNTKLSGSRWLTNPPDYLDAIWTEAAEAFNHTNFEWWKNKDREVDYGQIKMEVIDILHFLISHILANSVHIKEPELLATVFTEGQVEIKENVDKYPQTLPQLKFVLKKFINIATLSPSDFKRTEGDSQIHSLIAGFLVLLHTLKMDWTEIYKLYVGKNLLNTFRQQHGYKKDSDAYKAKWFEIEGRGWEDNQFLTEFLEVADLDKPVEALQKDIEAVLAYWFHLTKEGID